MVHCNENVILFQKFLSVLHPLTKLGHRDLLFCDPKTKPSALPASTTRHRVRRDSGLVPTPLSEKCEVPLEDSTAGWPGLLQPPALRYLRDW
jgi:hypothetical protein